MECSASTVPVRSLLRSDRLQYTRLFLKLEELASLLCLRYMLNDLSALDLAALYEFDISRPVYFPNESVIDAPGLLALFGGLLPLKLPDLHYVIFGIDEVANAEGECCVSDESLVNGYHC